MNHSDPWRYVCPQCGSTQTEKRTEYGRETIKGGCKPAGPYYCKHCGPINGLKDKKTGKITA